MPNPYFDKDGIVVIPFDSNRKYHWWNGGLSVAETAAELAVYLPADERDKALAANIPPPSNSTHFIKGDNIG